MIPSYPDRKVGENIDLRYPWLDAVGAGIEISAAIITITNARGEAVVSGAWVAMLTASESQYWWTPSATGTYLVEWHSIHGDAVDLKSSSIQIRIVPCLGSSAEFSLGPEAAVPTVLPYLHLPGTFTLPDGTAVGDPVALTGETTAVLASRTGAAAEAVVLEMLSATSGRLAMIATLDVFTGLTAGAPLYLGVDGAYSHTPSTTAGEVDQLVGLALSATRAALWLVSRPRALAVPTASNKAMAASVTTADFQEACATPIAATPRGYVAMLVEGVQQECGDGVRTKDWYFSGDGGATARAIASIVAGDLPYWVGSVAGFQLAAGMKIDLNYNV